MLWFFSYLDVNQPKLRMICNENFRELVSLDRGTQRPICCKMYYYTSINENNDDNNDNTYINVVNLETMLVCSFSCYTGGGPMPIAGAPRDLYTQLLACSSSQNVVAMACYLLVILFFF